MHIDNMIDILFYYCVHLLWPIVIDFLTADFGVQHERHSFLTACDHSNDLWASRMSMSRWSNSTGAQRSSEATRLSISPAPANSSGATKKAEMGFMQLAHFGQPKPKAPSPTGPPLTIKTRKEIRNCRSILRKETKKWDVRVKAEVAARRFVGHTDTRVGGTSRPPTMGG